MHCPACGGSGEVRVLPPVKSCVDYGGNGRAVSDEPFPILRGGQMLCPVCKGTGWLTPENAAARYERRCRVGASGNVVFPDFEVCEFVNGVVLLDLQHPAFRESVSSAH